MGTKTARDFGIITAIYIAATVFLYGYFAFFTKGGPLSV